jgi:PKD repeat protein
MKTSALLTGMLVVLAIGSGVAEAGRNDGVAGNRSATQRASTGTSSMKPEQDNPGARHQWKDEWYNENYGQNGRQAKRRLFTEGLWSPAYRRFMMDAAKRERLRHAAKMPLSARSAVVIDPRRPMLARRPADSANEALRWENIGPTEANFARNGVELNVTDTGRVRTILTDPANPNTLYAAFAGGGLWRSLDGGAFWQAMTETLGSLSIGVLAMDPNNAATLYLGLGDPFDGTGLGIVKMTERGEKWTDLVLLGDSTSIRDILVPPSNSNIVLVATDRGLYRSTDAGRTYVQVAIGGAQNRAVWSFATGVATVTNNVGTHAIVMSLQNGNAGEIWRSTDSGLTWVRANGIANAATRISLASAPSNRDVMYAMAARAAPADNAATPDVNESGSDLNNIYRSTDGGANWAAIATNAAGAYLNYSNPIASPNPAQSPNANLGYRSIGYLLNGQGWYNHAIQVDPTNADIAYFGGALIVARGQFVNNAWQFTRMSDWLAQRGEPYVHADMHAMHFSRNPNDDPANPNDNWRFYVGSDGGIFHSNDGLDSFSDRLNIGISSHLIYNVCSSPDRPAAVLVGLQDNGTRVRVVDAQGRGTSVYNQVIGGDGFGCNINIANADNMLGSLYNTRVLRSTDAGQNFAEVCFERDANNRCRRGLPNSPFKTSVIAWAGAPSAQAAPTGDTVYTHTYLTIYRSTDYFANFATVGTTGLPADRIIRGFAVARTNNTRPAGTDNNDDIMGVILNGGRIFLTTTGGRQPAPVNGVAQNAWTAAAALPGNAAAADGGSHRRGLSSITFDPLDCNTLYVTSVTPNQNATHVWRSTDFGRNWAAIDTHANFPRGIPVNAITVDHVVPQTIYAATHLGVYRSRDRGTTWERFGAWLPLVNVTDVQVAADGNSARAATFGRGVWEMSDITGNVAPVASFNSQVNGLTATFDNTSADNDGRIARSIWNFGDGVSSSMTSPNHTYAQAGTYRVTLTVTDNGGLSHTRVAEVTVGNVAPVANFDVAVNDLTATFTDRSADSDGNIASWSWTFDDGTNSNLASPSKTYAAAGAYNVRLTVTDNNGASHSATRLVRVAAPPPPAGNALANGVAVSVTLASKASQVWTLVVPAGATNLRFATTGGAGDADLYVRFGSAPTTTTFDCRKNGSTSTETCDIANVQAGTYHVMVFAYDAIANVSLTGSFTPPAGNALANGVAVNGITLAAEASRTWTMVVPAGASNLRFATTGGSGDADLYVRFGSAPTTATFDCRKDGSTTTETCDIANVQAGTYHVMVYAYKAIDNVRLTGSFTPPAAAAAPRAASPVLRNRTTR